MTYVTIFFPRLVSGRTFNVTAKAELSMDKRVEAVVTLMMSDLRREHSLPKLAQSVNLSTSRFYYLFKSEISMPPARYLKIIRMRAAKHLLETTFLSVKEIVARSGFNDESHFVRNFKKLYGVTPGKHRSQVGRSDNREGGPP